MHYLKLFPSKYLSASDIPEGKTLTATIDRVALEPVQSAKGVDEKLMIYFSDYEKPLVCNKTNANAIAAKLGTDTDEWKGQAVTFRESVTSFEGLERPCVRVK